MSTIIARAAESVHWYKQDGGPQYTVKAKDGSDRPTTLRDARKMDLVPSVSTVLKIAAKPGLEQWKLEQMLLAALTLPKAPDEPEKAYIARIVADSKETGKQAAEAGTRIHDEVHQVPALGIENFVLVELGGIAIVHELHDAGVSGAQGDEAAGQGDRLQDGVEFWLLQTLANNRSKERKLRLFLLFDLNWQWSR